MQFISNVFVGDMTLEKEREDFILIDYSDFSKARKGYSVAVKNAEELVSIAIVFLKIKLAVHLSS